MTTIIRNKIESVQRCILRAKFEYEADKENFLTNFSRQDAAILNVLRACQTTIDIANHIIKKNKFGLPKSSVESFDILCNNLIIDNELNEKMKKMASFRNLLIHEYAKSNIKIIEEVIINRLIDLVNFTDKISEYSKQNKY